MSEDSMTGDDFATRRAKAREEVNRMDQGLARTSVNRNDFFDSVYASAKNDAARVPWADLAPKDKLLQWLEDNPGNSETALDVACGLGDNAEAMAQAGYRTTGFDISADAIAWAKQRFPRTAVDYQVADLRGLANDWHNSFDLVHECYTLQALPPEMFEETARAIAALARPGGTLLVYTRVTTDPAQVAGPPWPLTESQYTIFAQLGYQLVRGDEFVITRPDKTIPHVFAVWRKLQA